jgi:hypothetical protein
MKTTVSQCDFHDAFRRCDRLEQFSYHGRNALFEYLEEYEESTGEELELDVISLCCDYSEYSSALDAAGNYDPDFNVDDATLEAMDEFDREELEEKALAYLQDHTTVIVHDEGVIVESF